LKTLAIDADTSPNLALTLGLSPEQAGKILPVAENQDLIEEKTRTDYPGVFKLVYTVDDIVARQGVLTPCGVQLLVMGTVRTMGGGCACPAHNLMRTLLAHLIVEREEAVILDMEAGIEHLGRGTAKNVDLLLIVTDASQTSLITAGRIADLAVPSGIPRIGCVANRISGADLPVQISAMAKSHTIPVMASIPYDQDLLEAGMNGQSPVLKEGFPAVSAVRILAELIMNENPRNIR
jgi:CO dehydrogenase maturation factor